MATVDIARRAALALLLLLPAGCGSTPDPTAGASSEPSLSVAADGSAAAGSPGASASASAAASATPGKPASCGLYAFDKPSTATLRSAKKKAFAYYFPPYPVSIDNKSASADYWAKWRANGVPGVHQGDGVLDRPLTRSVRSGSDWRQQDFATEVRQAIAIGLDGFIWEYHSVSSDARWTQLPAMLAAAKSVDPGFRIMLSPDLQQGADTSPDQIVTDVLKVKDAANLYKVDGSIVLAPFYPERKPAAWWTGVRTTLAGQGVKTVLVPIFLSGSPATRSAEWNSAVYGYSLWGNRWVSGADTDRVGAQQAHAAGRAYMAPIAFEDDRLYDGRYWESSGSGALRAMMEKAIAGDADWVALITWNDYTESWVAPSVERGYAVADVMAYYTAWLKTGKRPGLVRDALYYFHRSQKAAAAFTGTQTVTMKVPYGDPAVDRVELLAYLAGAGRLVIRQGSQVSTKDVTAAGLVSFTAALVPGTTPVFELQRGGAVVQRVTSRTPIRTAVVHQDLMYHAGGGTACGGH
ncbi:glycoside hydrolase family 71 protein [Hamadaea tsunoensis]|uniref:glycoside hydrolase family 71 protein n=1 Tax=Hamadaea tsunoensis TaxID=53368 RepID=UPI00041CCBEB|nr:glycoside hydrolase family 71 protein [Hamadaea tsunoensis]